MVDLAGMNDHEAEVRANVALLQAFAPHEELRQLAAGAVLFSEGQSPAGIYVLLSGVIEMKFSADPAAVQMSALGTILGLNAIVSGHPLDYTATASGPAVVGFVSSKQFFTTMAESPALWMHALKVLARDIGSCYQRVREVAGTTSTRFQNGRNHAERPETRQVS